MMRCLSSTTPVSLSALSLCVGAGSVPSLSELQPQPPEHICDLSSAAPKLLTVFPPIRFGFVPSAMKQQLSKRRAPEERTSYCGWSIASGTVFACMQGKQKPINQFYKEEIF